MPPGWWRAFGTPWEPFDVFGEEDVMADFDAAWPVLMDLEGWGRDHHNAGDPGGRTIWGIAKNRHPSMWRGGPPTEEEARAFYVRTYWDPLRLGELRNQEMADEILEMAVNTSTPKAGRSNVAIRTAQQAVNDVRRRETRDLVSEDGVVGPQTIEALNEIDPKSVESLAWDGRFNLRQLRYYRGLPEHLVELWFLSWSRRVIA